MDLTFIIPLIPRTKKNGNIPIINKKTGKPFILPSKAYQKYEKECKKFMPKIETINTPVNIKAVYYMPTKRQVDLINLHSALHDILVEYNVLADDNAKIVVSTDGSRVRYDKEYPRTEVFISEL